MPKPMTIAAMIGVLMTLAGCPMPEIGSGAIGPGSGPEASDDKTYSVGS